MCLQAVVTLRKEDRGNLLITAGLEALNVCSILQLIQVDEAQAEETNCRDIIQRFEKCCSFHKNETHQQCISKQRAQKTENIEVLMCEEIM